MTNGTNRPVHFYNKSAEQQTPPVGVNQQQKVTENLEQSRVIFNRFLFKNNDDRKQTSSNKFCTKEQNLTLTLKINKMKHFKISLTAIGLILGISTALIAARPEEPLYRHTTGEQTWGQTIDQNPSHYEQISQDPDCLSSNSICTYRVENGVFVQNSKGTLQ